VIADGRGRTKATAKKVLFFIYSDSNQKRRKGHLHILLVFKLKISFLYGLHCWFHLFCDCILNELFGWFLACKAVSHMKFVSSQGYIFNPGFEYKSWFYK
jgi:hypothetical protein